MGARTYAKELRDRFVIQFLGTSFTGLVVLIVGSGTVAIGGGGIQTMSRYWERAAQRVEQESTNVKQEAQGSADRIQQRKEQLQPTSTGSVPTGGETVDLGRHPGQHPPVGTKEPPKGAPAPGSVLLFRIGSTPQR